MTNEQHTTVNRGAMRTARAMAIVSHNLDRVGDTAICNDGSTWKWSSHFNIWFCVTGTPTACTPGQCNHITSIGLEWICTQKQKNIHRTAIVDGFPVWCPIREVAR
jgi:hypothetical protein